MAAAGDMNVGMSQLQTALLETERLGELLLAVKDKMVEVDRRRQETREALTALRKQPSSIKVVLRRPAGATLRISNDRSQAILQQDQIKLEAQLDDLRAQEKRLVGQLVDKGIAPEAVGPQLINAMLNLKA